MKINLFDSHVHSDNSHDGKNPIMYICEYAKDNRIMGFSITDHFECDETQNMEKQCQAIKQSVFETELANTTFSSKIRLTKGIELGQPHYQPEISDKILNDHKFDFVIASVHKNKNQNDFAYINFDDHEIVIKNVMEEYFLSCLELAKYNKFDSFAHLGYPIRYIWGKYRIPFDINLHIDIIDEILKTLIANNKALEINTGGMRTPLAQANPDFDILKRYKDFGGELVTIGSDAHIATDMCYAFDIVMEKMLELGYKYFAFYKERQPVMLKII